MEKLITKHTKKNVQTLRKAVWDMAEVFRAFRNLRTIPNTAQECEVKTKLH